MIVAGFMRTITRSHIAIALVLLLCMISAVSSVSAEPKNSDTSSPLVEMKDLARQAGIASEGLISAKEEIRDANKRIARADKDVKDASLKYKVAEKRRGSIQSQINSIAKLNATSALMSGFAALLVSESPTELMNRVQMQSIRSQSMKQTVIRHDKAVKDASQAKESAEQAKAAGKLARKEAEDERTRLIKRREELRGKIAAVRKQFGTLSAAEREEWVKIHIPEGFDPSIAFGTNERGNKALRAAITRIGSPYVWGATGPRAFDCSGLMLWAYQQTGLTIPRTAAAQLHGGKTVSRQDLQPGDLVIFYAGASHVGMYAGDGKVLHAPDFGVPVQVGPMDSMPYRGAVRY